MTIILDHYMIPQKGCVKLTSDDALIFRFNIHITAEEARRKVDRWLHQQVSMLISAEEPTLVVGKQTLWRVPAAISFPSLGRVGVVGTVGVDIESGQMQELAKCKAEIERYLEEEIKPRLPPYKMRKRPVSAEFIPKHLPPAPKLALSEGEELILPDDEQMEVPA